MIDPQDFRRERYNNLEMVVERMPVDFRGRGYENYSPEQLKVIAELQKEAELKVLLILDVLLFGVAVILWWGAWQ